VIDTGLRGKVVLITGVNNPHGIGAAAARAFAAEGAAVFITYLRVPCDGATGADDAATPGDAFYRAQKAKSGDGVASALREQGARVEAEEADLTDHRLIPRLFDRVEGSLGPVDVLVDNAAHCAADTFVPEKRLGPESRAADRSPMSAITADTHDRHFAVNSRAAALMMAEYARRHVERGAHWGRIVNISTDGASGFSTEVSYGASKHALESYSRAAASELGRYGITVNVVSPGAVQTGWISPELEREAADRVPLGRIGRPEEVADAIVFFASEQARWITGQLLYVGGGHVMPL